MDKLENIAYMIMEAVSEPAKPVNLQVNDKNGLFFLRFETALQRFNAFNRNRRKYFKEPMLQSLNAPHIQELIRNKAFAGEAGHPMSDEVKRILTIDPKLTSHKITSLNCVGDILKGGIETLDDGHYGTQMTKNILQGMEPSFSLRALAPLMKQPDGSHLMRSKAHIVTYDWVILPSHEEAYRDKNIPIQKIIKNIENSGNTVQESMIAVMESQITDFIKFESENVKLVSNVCEVAMESMSLSPDLKYAILKENNETFYVKIEDKIKMESRRYMSKL